MGKVLQPSEPTASMRAQFLEIVREIYISHREVIDKEREYSLKRTGHPDVLWRELVKNIIGQGSDAGLQRLNTIVDVPSVLSYEALLALPEEQRAAEIEATLRSGGVRWPAMKAPWIAENVAKMKRRHGPANALALFEEAPGREGKIAFLKRFAGVGDKVSRNIPMNLYHPEFRDSIAIDARISGISKRLGLRPRGYDLEERWYVTAAHEAGLDGWTLDRLLYHAHAVFIDRLEQARAAKESV